MEINKNGSVSVAVIVVVVAVLAIGAGIFLYPYDHDSPPVADSNGSNVWGVQGFVDANNQFAFDLYSKISEDEKGNLFYSPYSISAALAMTYEGAKGNTAEEIANVFHFPSAEIMRPNFAEVYDGINSGSDFYELKTGNALWLQQDYPFIEDYVNTVENYYGGKAAGVDFIKETEKSRQTINSFIEEQTNNKIKNLIPQGILNSLTRLVLTNAIYFKGDWKWEFDKSDTRDMTFNIDPENSIQTPMMHMDPEKAEFNYVDTGKVQVLELPYKGDELSMLILLPKQGEEYKYETGESKEFDYTLDDIDLSLEKLEEYRNQMEETKLDGIYLPKFEFDTKYFMANMLSSMGMPTAFSGSADFSGMTEAEKLFISRVIHEAYVKVDEEGTEAAAATAVLMGETSAGPSNLKIFKADHPFVFVIQQKDTGNILFMGRVNDPSQ